MLSGRTGRLCCFFETRRLRRARPISCTRLGGLENAITTSCIAHYDTGPTQASLGTATPSPPQGERYLHPGIAFHQPLLVVFIASAPAGRGPSRWMPSSPAAPRTQRGRSSVFFLFSSLPIHSVGKLLHPSCSARVVLMWPRRLGGARPTCQSCSGRLNLECLMGGALRARVLASQKPRETRGSRGM